MARSVPIGDAALRLGLTLEELAEVAGRCVGWRGMLRARRAMNFLDARSESAGESYSRVVLDRIGIPAPIPFSDAPPFSVTPHVLVGRERTKWGVSKKAGRHHQHGSRMLCYHRLAAEGAVRQLDHRWS